MAPAGTSTRATSRASESGTTSHLQATRHRRGPCPSPAFPMVLLACYGDPGPTRRANGAPVNRHPIRVSSLGVSTTGMRMWPTHLDLSIERAQRITSLGSLADLLEPVEAHGRLRRALVSSNSLRLD